MSELPLLAILRAADPVREDMLRTFGDNEEAAIRFAVRWAWDHRRVKSMTQKRAAELVGIPAPHFSCILSGQKNLPPHKINEYEMAVGVRAVSMTIDRFRGIREQQLVAGLAKMVAENIVKAA